MGKQTQYGKIILFSQIETEHSRALQYWKLKITSHKYEDQQRHPSPNDGN